MENSNIKLKKELEQMSKEAYERLMLQEDIIKDYQERLQNEEKQNTDLKKKVVEYENKLASIDEKLDHLDICDTESGNQIKNKTTMSFNQSQNIPNMNNMFSTNLSHQQDMLKVIEEKNELQTKFDNLSSEFQNSQERNKNLKEIEDIYKTKLNSQSRKIDNLEKIVQHSKEREEYIEELMNRYNNLEKDYTSILANKDDEIASLRAQLGKEVDRNERLSNQLNYQDRSTSENNEKMLNEIQALEEKNREMEMELYKNEVYYKEEISKLNRLIEEFRVKEEKEKEKDKDIVVLSRQNPSSSLKVEDLTTSLSKTIRERIESQNKKISSQNVEILALQYEIEKLTSDLKYEKDLNNKLQTHLAEKKYVNTCSVTCDIWKEDSQVQTVLKMDDIESTKTKMKILEENLTKMTESNQDNLKKLNSYIDKAEMLTRTISDRENEIAVLMKKLDKAIQNNKNPLMDKDSLVVPNLSEVSKLNMVISTLKMRENELIERIQLLESGKGGTTNLISSKKESLSFNISDDSNAGVNCSNLKNHANHIPTTGSIELEFRRMQEDNLHLMEQNFKLISDITKANENLSKLSKQGDCLKDDKEKLETTKQNLIEHYEHAVKELTIEIEKSKKINNENIEDMRGKIQSVDTNNQKLNEQFTALQNKFYVQSQMLNDKNYEIANEKKLKESIMKDYESLKVEYSQKDESNKRLEMELKQVRGENEKLKKESVEANEKYGETSMRSNYMIAQLEERVGILREENEKIREYSEKIKIKLNDMYEEKKQKENQIICTLKEESREIEATLRRELNEIRAENEVLLKERSGLRAANNELKYELDNIRETNTTNANTAVPALNKSIRRNTTTLNNSLLPQNSYENEMKNLKEENNMLKAKLEDAITSANTNEKKAKAFKLDLTSLENENKRYADIIRIKESEITKLENDINDIKINIKALTQENSEVSNQNIEQLLNEISTKNQTINYLIDEVEKTKQESSVKISELEMNLKRLREDNEMLARKLSEGGNSLNEYKQYAESVINDLKKENEILINDLNVRESEYEAALKDKIRVENNFEDKFKLTEIKCEKIEREITKLQEENGELKEKLEEALMITCDKFTQINAHVNKGKSKLEKLISVHESHIKFLKERFDHILNDIVIAYNTIKPNTSGANTNSNPSSNSKDIPTEKFIKLMKSIEGSIDLVNKISEREALIENFKRELKTLKANQTTANSTIKRLEKENADMNELLTVKKLQMKLKQSQGTGEINIPAKVRDVIALTENNVKVSELKTKYSTAISEIKMLNDKLTTMKENITDIEGKTSSLKDELSCKNKEIAEMNKIHRCEIFKFMEELKKIKETWIPNDKKIEYINQIEELEKSIKNLKDDCNRKRELIVTLKSQLNDKNDKDKDYPQASSSNIKDSGCQDPDKIKSLNKDIARKDNLIKELKANLDTVKTNEKKLTEENEGLTEKCKIIKIDISRKENIIKELKEKMNSLSSNQELFNSSLESKEKEVSKKFKQEIERKDGILRTLKAKIESLNFELEQLRTLNLKLSKNNFNEVEKEQKQHSQTREKLDSLTVMNENLMSILRRIFKDLISTYERAKIRLNVNNVSNTMKEGMEILGVSENELDEYLNPNPGSKIELYDRINEMMDSANVDVDTIMNIYGSLKDKILGNDGLKLLSGTQNNNFSMNRKSSAGAILNTNKNSNFLLSKFTNTNRTDEFLGSNSFGPNSSQETNMKIETNLNLNSNKNSKPHLFK